MSWKKYWDQSTERKTQKPKITKWIPLQICGKSQQRNATTDGSLLMPTQKIIQG